MTTFVPRSSRFVRLSGLEYQSLKTLQMIQVFSAS
jgi:hypothetical protein